MVKFREEIEVLSPTSWLLKLYYHYLRGLLHLEILFETFAAIQ